MTSPPTFPAEGYSDPADYLAAYAEMTAAGWRSVDRAAVRRASEILLRAYQEGRQVFVCGNGGSAAIANHLTCDCSKNVSTNTTLRPRVVSLSATVELMTAIANDVEYAEIFVRQLKNAARPGDVLITISSSGDSENIVRALAWARDNGLTTIAMSGFSGGRSAKTADISLHVAAENYGVVEDAHQALMHILAQYVRMSEIPEAALKTLRF